MGDESEIEPPFEEDAKAQEAAPPSAVDINPPIQDEKKEGTPKDGEGIATSFQVKEDLSKYKTKVAVRLLKALEEMKPDNPYRSPDLVPLTTDFQDMRKKLKSLIVSAKAYQTATAKVEDARAKVSHFQCHNHFLF